MFAKKCSILVLSACLFLGACGGRDTQNPDEAKRGVTIEVNTMYGGDEYQRVFTEATAKWEEETGYKVSVSTNSSDEAYKKRILMDFQTGAEPDVLFYFSGMDSNPLVANKRVISLEEIRKVYPEYATNMKDGMMKASTYDGKVYAVPVNGYWEALYVNLKALSSLGFSMPDKETNWDEFLLLCEDIRKAGKTPIAASLAEIPHYWFEYCIYNHQTPESHSVVPEFLVDNMAQAWIAGLKDIKSMYDKGYFPDNTLYISDEGAKEMFLSGEAVFLLEGSWYASTINDRPDSGDFAVTYVPGTDTRKTTDIISGLSSGYFITKKAWEDEEKREAAVRFVEYMTGDEMVSRFSSISATALKNGTDPAEDLSGFLRSARDMAEGATGFSEAVQDFVPASCRAPIFDNMQRLMQGTAGIEDAVREVIALKKQRTE
ncbi:MAG: extracellular solute-binding protein [Lachnospiraceae bacterium]|nr:extracellular solute-binding protein [Lachnospiraceae bacterium]